MNFYYLLTLGILLFIWGILYIVKVLKSNDETVATPIADIKEITSLKESYLSEPKVSTDFVADPMTNHILKQNLMDKPAAGISVDFANGLAQDIKLLQEKVSSLMSENSNLKDALEREVLSKKDPVVHSNDELTNLSSELLRLKEVNARLTEEILRVERIEKEKLTQSQEIVKKLTDEIAKLTQDDQKHIKTLEQELEEVNQGKEREHTNKLVLDQLSAQNQEFLFQVREKEGALKALVDEKEKLVVEYENKINQFEERLEYMQNKLIKEDQQVLLGKLQETHENLRVIASENERLQKLNVQLLGEVKDLKFSQELIVEREKFLQYELTKTRAQQIGLERLCQDFKQQIEATAS